MTDNIIKKVNYFDGLFLTEEEFKTEQNYHIRLRRQHNAYFHGFGIIEGLEVYDPGTSGNIGVRKGAAIDRMNAADAAGKMGREIILTADAIVNIYESGIAAGYEGVVYVCLTYEDFPDNISPDKGGETEIHLLERPKVICRTTDPTPTDPEADTDMVVLSRIHLNAGGDINSIDDDVRVYAGFVGNQVTTGELTVNGPAEIVENLTVKGDLKVEGEFEKEMIIKDDIITLNKVDSGPISLESGLEIFRGTANPARLIWSETDERWKIGIQGQVFDLVYGPNLDSDLSSGNVGIGTGPTTSEKLSVAGNVKINGQTQIIGNTIIGDTTPADLTVTGDLKVEGDFKQELKTRDDIITLNKGEAGPTSDESGLEIFRGSDAAARLIWSETDARWKIGIQGQVYNLVYGTNLDSDPSSGNVGIGTAPTASEKLSVSGKVIIDGETQIRGETIIGETSNPANLTVSGNLKVEGDFEQELKTKDDIITLNKGPAGPTSSLSGIEIFRGAQKDAANLLWDDADEKWKIGEGESLNPIATINQLSTGVSKEIFQKAHDLKPGMAIFFDGDAGRYLPALSNNEATVGIFMVAKVQNENNFTLVQAGYIEGLDGLIPGEYYYVSDTEKGRLTSTEPPQISNPILIADSKTSGFVLPYRPNEIFEIPESPWQLDGSGNISFNAGMVGIGESNPTAKLHIGGVAGTDGIRFPDGTLQTTADGGTNAEFEALQNEVIEARGTTASLDNRLDESLTEAGTLQESVVGIEQLNDRVLGKLVDFNRIHRVPLLQQTLFSRSIEVPTSKGPSGMAFDGRHLWVANFVNANVSKINPADNSVTAIPISGSPVGVAFDGTHIYVTDRANNSVSKIDIETNETVAKISVDKEPWGMAFDGTHMWVANSAGNTLSKINIATNKVDTFSAGLTPSYIAFDGTHIWVTNRVENSVSKIDIVTNIISAKVSVGSTPADLAFDGTHIWVAIESDNYVNKIDFETSSVIAKVKTDEAPRGIAFDGRHIWVTNNKSNNVSKIDIAENRVVATIPVGPGPWGIAFDGQYLWVGNYLGGSVSRILRVM